LKNYRSYKDDRIYFVRAGDGLRGAPYYVEPCIKCLKKEMIMNKGDVREIDKHLTEEPHICTSDTEIKLENGDTAHRPVEQEIGGEVLKVALDKQRQRFVIFLVRKSKDETVNDTNKSPGSARVKQQKSLETDSDDQEYYNSKPLKEGQKELSLRIYVNKCTPFN